MNSPAGNNSSKTGGEGSRASHVWNSLIGYVIAVLCLVWVFHDVEIKELFRSAGSINWLLVAAAVIVDVVSYVCQGLRWSMLLHPLGRISVRQSTEAIYAGLFVNEILPMRVGEVLRTYLISRWNLVRFADVLPSVLIERFWDAIWLAIAFGITVLCVPLPRYLVNAEKILGYGVLAATAVLIYLLLSYKQETTGRDSTARSTSRILRLISKLADGIRHTSRSRFFYGSFGVSFLLLLGQIVSYWLVMQAYGLRLSFWHGAAIFLILHVGTAIPSAPSNIGTYQFFTVLGLTLFGIEKTLATGFSIVVFLVLTIPLWAIGLLVFARLGLDLKTLRSEIAALRTRQKMT